MRILIIGTNSTSESVDAYYGEYVRFFQRAAAQTAQTTQVSFALFDDLIISVGDQGFSITNTRLNDDLSTYDLLILRGTGFRGAFDVIKTISSYAHKHDIRIINDYAGFRDSSKLTQAVQFYEAAIPVAQTIYVTRAVLEATSLPITFPCILKATFGAHGKDNYIVQNISEAADIVVKTPAKGFVLQQFVPNDRDYRVLKVGNEILVIERKAAQGSHLNNTSQGGSATLVPPETLPSQALADARRIMERLAMTIAGVDILVHAETGQYYFLEVNSQPQLMSGALVAEKAAAVGRYLATLT